jgi:hypothetical protein
MPVMLPVSNLLRLAAALLGALSRRLAAAAASWCPPPLEPDDHLLRDIGKSRAELLGLLRGQEAEPRRRRNAPPPAALRVVAGFAPIAPRERGENRQPPG